MHGWESLTPRRCFHGGAKNYLCDVHHCNIDKGVSCLSSLCSSQTNEQMKVCMAGVCTMLINKEQPWSQETTFQTQLHYQLAIPSWPSHCWLNSSCLGGCSQKGFHQKIWFGEEHMTCSWALLGCETIGLHSGMPDLIAILQKIFRGLPGNCGKHMHLFNMVVALEGSSGNIKPCCKR